jgi:uncharacterized protein (TIGR04255 family)
MGTPLKHPPVYFTLAQVRFNPILKLAEYVPSIQEAFRQAGYPDFAAHDGFAIKIAMQNGLPKPEPQVVNRYSFGDREKTHNFALDSDSLTLHSTDYGRFESFAGKFEDGLERVHEAVRLDFVERIGLRYLDQIVPLGTDKLEQYLVPQALGVRDLIAGQPLHSYCETLVQVSGAKLLSRVFTQSGQLGFPPDIGQHGLQLQERFKAPPSLHAVLDTDGFVEQRIPYSISAVRNHLNDLHKIIGNTFEALATEHAFRKWSE